MSRKNYDHTTKPQTPKTRNAKNHVFRVFRPVALDSAESLYELTKKLQEDNILPENSTLKDPSGMHVTYLERNRLSRELQGFAQGFNAKEAISRIDRHCTDTSSALISAQLGRVSLMDRRDEMLVVRLDHNQVVAEEYQLITSALRTMRLNIRDDFRPHISLARVPNQEFADKIRIAREMQQVLPNEVQLSPLVIEPSLRQRGV